MLHAAPQMHSLGCHATRTCQPLPLPPATKHSTGVIPEVRRRRYFENSVDAKKRKVKEARMAAKRQSGSIRSFGQVSGQEPAPFSDMFGGEASEIDIFF